MIRGLLVEPDEFLGRKVNQAGIRLEILVVLLVGALSVPGVAYVVLAVLEAEDSSQMEIAAAGQAVRPLVVVVVLWIAYALALHFISTHYRGRGPPGPVLKGTAWALVPLGIGNVAQSIAMYLAFRNVDVSARLEGYGASERLQAVMDSGMDDPIVLVSVVVFAATVVWSGYLMSIVVARAKDISEAQARKVVAVPVVLHLIVVAVAVVQASPNFGLVLVSG